MFNSKFSFAQNNQISELALSMTPNSRQNLFGEVTVSAVKDEIKQGFQWNKVNGRVENLEQYLNQVAQAIQGNNTITLTSK